MYKLIQMGIAALVLSGCIVTDALEVEDLDTTSSKLELYINFDSQTAEDLSGNNYNGFTGGSRFVTNTPNGTGYAYNIVEVTDILTIPYNPFGGISEYSICFWLRDPSQGLLMNCYGNDTNSSSANYPTIRISDNLLYSGFSSYSMDDYFNYNTANILQNGNWHYLVITATSSVQSLYIDGTKVSTQASSLSESKSSEIYFGGSLSNYAGALMKIDNIRIYSRAISAQEISLIYNNEK